MVAFFITHKLIMKVNLNSTLLVKNVKNLSMIPAANCPIRIISLAVGWNFLDAVANLITATQLLLDKSNYQQVQNKMKAALMIFSSAQLFALSYAPWLAPLGVAGLTSATALAAPAFALATLIDLSVASIDFYYAAKKIKFDGWLEEQTKEWNHIQEEIDKGQTKINEIKIKIEEHLLARPEKQEQELERLTNKLDHLVKKQAGLEDKQDKCFNDIQARCWANRDATNDVYIKTQLSKMKKIANYTLKDESREQSKDFKNYFINRESLNNDDKFTEYKNLSLPREKEIRDNLTENYNKKLDILGVKSLSFIGCTLLAIAPFTGPAAPALFAAGAIICGSVALYYAYNHREAIQNKVGVLANAVKKKFESALKPSPNSLSFASSRNKM